MCLAFDIYDAEIVLPLQKFLFHIVPLFRSNSNKSL